MCLCDVIEGAFLPYVPKEKTMHLKNHEQLVQEKPLFVEQNPSKFMNKISTSMTIQENSKLWCLFENTRIQQQICKNNYYPRISKIQTEILAESMWLHSSLS